MTKENMIEKLGLVLTRYKDIKIGEIFYFDIMKDLNNLIPYVRVLEGPGWTADRIDNNYTRRGSSFCFFSSDSNVWVKRIVIVI